MKNTPLILTAEMEVSEILLGPSNEVEQVIGAGEINPYFDLENASQELVDMLLSQTPVEELPLQEAAFSNSAGTQLFSQFSGLAGDETQSSDTPPPPGEDPSPPSGGGGLSHLSANTLSGHIGEPLVGETGFPTTFGAFSGSGVLKNDGLEDSLDGLFGANPPFTIIDRFAPALGPEVAFQNVQFQQEIPIVETACNIVAVGDSFIIPAEGDGLINFTFSFFFTGNGEDIDGLLDNDIADGKDIFVKLVESAEVPGAGGEGSSFMFVNDGETVTGTASVSSESVTLMGSTTDLDATFSLSYQIGYSGDPSCCSTGIIEFSFDQQVID